MRNETTSALCRVAAAVVGAVLLWAVSGNCLTVTTKSFHSLGKAADSKKLLRVYFDATDEGKPYQGSRDELARMVLVNGVPAKEYLFEGRAPEIAEKDTTVDIVFVLGIDVSGSMGGSNYDERMGPLSDALRSFVDKSSEFENLWLTLLPFGHECPFDLAQWGSSEWEGKYLRPSNPDDLVRLKTGIDGIASFVRASGEHKVVDTGLWLAMFQGITGITKMSQGETQFKGASGALILLTDGKNDLENQPPDARANSYTKEMVNGLFLNPDAPMVYALAFGSEAAADDIVTGAFKDTGNKTSLKRVGTGTDAASELSSAYVAILEKEAKAWSMVLALPDAVDAMNLRITGTEGPGPLVCMLFLPSPLFDMTSTHRLLVIGISGLALVALCNVWYLARYKLGRRPARAATPREPSAAPVIPPPRQVVEDTPRGMSVQEWERRKKRSN